METQTVTVRFQPLPELTPLLDQGFVGHFDLLIISYNQSGRLAGKGL
jgi:hypothetical protein